jgi:hypothetical protein
MIYIENFSFLCFISSLWKVSKYKNFSTIYYIDASAFSKRVLVPILSFFGKKIYQLDFKMTEIVDDSGELIRLRIHRYDLLAFKEEILKSKAYKALFDETWNQNNIIEYINKGLTDGSVLDANSVIRMLYIINVVNWHGQKSDNNKSVFIINKRPWLNLFQAYSDKFNIKIIETRSSFFNSFTLRKYIRNFPILYNILKNYKYQNYTKNNKNPNMSNNNLFLDGRGDISLDNDGMHSDFFWQQNSEFLLKNIIYKHYSDQERDYFVQNDLQSISDGVYSNGNDYRQYSKPKLNYSKQFKLEYKFIKNLLNSYDLDRFNISALFRKFGVKVLLSWDKYSNDHMVWSDAIKDNGGISVIWQLAFDGHLFAESLTNSDIVFSYSKFSNEIEKKLQSKIKYNVIVGYPKDYASALLKDDAYLIRSQLKVNGAKKIVFVIDENSVDDSRWHTGHELQRENYSYILEKLFDEPWLGVVFKPKNINSLRQRLGQVEELLDRALATGRCYIFEDVGRHTTSAPPILAGLASDVCIHGHLCAGTAAIECALEGIPTLLIDREGCPYSKFYELPEGKVIFNNWPETIDAIMEHFTSDNGIPGFGDWSSIIDDLDPFRDGQAANRMGTYLSWLMEGYEEGLEKDLILKNAAEKYRDKWGHDKVIMKLDNS